MTFREEVLGHLASLKYDRDDRKAHGSEAPAFKAGWTEARKGHTYEPTTLQQLTWQNSGWRFAQAYPESSDADRDAIFEVLFEQFVTSAFALAGTNAPEVRGGFRHDDVFPVVVRLIFEAYRETQNFVGSREIATLLQEDPEGSELVADAADTIHAFGRKDTAANMVSWFSQRITIGQSQWKDLFDRERRDGVWAYRPMVEKSLVSEADFAAIEGNPRLYPHFRRERDRALIRRKKEAVLADIGFLQCECCGFQTTSAFPFLECDICEVHHRIPLGSVQEAVETRLADLAILCPNCHRAIHRTNPLMPIEDFGLLCAGQAT